MTYSVVIACLIHGFAFAMALLTSVIDQDYQASALYCIAVGVLHIALKEPKWPAPFPLLHDVVVADSNYQFQNFNKENRMPKKERPVIVTTTHRGVFFGYASDTDGETIMLKRSRLCLRWSADLRGFMGLAAMGPNGNCSIGPAADIMLRSITAVLEVSPEAEAKWNAAK